jgi:hypothetical protein
MEDRYQAGRGRRLQGRQRPLIGLVHMAIVVAAANPARLQRR